MQKHLKTAIFLAHLLDNEFSLFGVKFGLDPILGLIPGIGDAVSLLISLYIVWVGFKLKATPGDLLKMLKNVVIDTFAGSLPVVGDAFDFAYHANLKNIAIIAKYEKDTEILDAEVVD